MFTRKLSLIALSLLLATPLGKALQITMSVEDVLTRVRANIAEYQTSIPSFISDESVLSQRFGGEKLKDEMKIESSFEMVRSASGSDLRETRIKNLVNGRAPRSQKFAPPFGFSGGYADVIGFMGDKCVDYSFAEAPSAGNPIVIQVSRKPLSSDRLVKCNSQSYERKAFIDPKTFQVFRIEEAFQDVGTGIGGHLFFVPTPSNHNVLSFSVDYMPVELGGKTFWLTKAVTADLKDKNKPIRLHYEAHYANYHRFASSAKILPTESGDLPAKE